MASGTRRALVLIPGACLGGWVWREVAGALRVQGHEVHPVTLTGLGERVHLARPGVDLDTHIEDVVNLLDYNSLTDVVLVGHSYAGVVLRGVVDRRPQRVHAAVYLDTSPLPDGMALADLQPAGQRDRQRQVVEEQGQGWLWPVPDREALLEGTFGSAAGLNEEHLRLIGELATPQPYATMTSKLRLSNGEPAGVRRIAIFCSDGGMGLESLRALLAAKDPRAEIFAGEDWQLRELPTGHWPMLSQPRALAELLHDIAAS